MGASSKISRWKQLMYRQYFRSTIWQSAWSHRFTPAGRLWLACTVIAVLPGLNTRFTLAYQLVSLLASMLLVSAVTARFQKGPSRQKIHRQLKGVATAGQAYRYELQWRGELEQITSIELDDTPKTVQPSLRQWAFGHDDEKINAFDRWTGYRRFQSFVKQINPESRPLSSAILKSDHASFEIEIVFPRRGLFEWSHTNIYQTEPLGLMRSHRKVSLPQELLVLPPIIHLPDFHLPSRGSMRHQPDSLSLQVGYQGEFASIRDYHHGDSMRHIHWRSSAKTGGLRVMEYQEELSQRTALILDTSAKSDENFETAITIASAFCRQLPSEQMRVDLLFVADSCHMVSFGRNSQAPIVALKALACAQIHEDLGHQKLRQNLSDKMELMSSAVFITSQWEEDQRSLCSDLLKTGLPLVCIVIDRERSQNLGPFASQAQRWIHCSPHPTQPDLHALAKVK